MHNDENSSNIKTLLQEDQKDEVVQRQEVRGSTIAITSPIRLIDNERFSS